MSRFSLFARSVLGTAAVAFILAGCGAPQSGFGAMPQAVPEYGSSAIQPNGASPCPAIGKTYTTGQGHAKVRFSSAKAAVGRRKYSWATRLDFVNWPKQKKIPQWTMQLFTCGPQAGKKPIGTLLTYAVVHSDYGYRCVNGICHFYFDWSTDYQSPEKLPSGKPWKFDEAIFKFKTSEKGWGALPAERIQVVK